MHLGGQKGRLTEGRYALGWKYDGGTLGGVVIVKTCAQSPISSIPFDDKYGRMALTADDLKTLGCFTLHCGM